MLCLYNFTELAPAMWTNLVFYLDTDWVVLVHTEVVDEDLPLPGDGGEDGAGVGGPGHVPHLGIEVKHEQRLAENVSLVITLQYDINDHLQSLSQILMIHSEAQVMKMLGMKVFHCML